jgi:hypothetical protein
MNEKSTQAEKVEAVKLVKDHTHAGKDYKAGETIEVNAAEKAWLKALDVIAI